MNQEKLFDLHLHTLASDGTFTATEVVQRAKSVGLSIIAITDHDSVEALAEARVAGEKEGIEIIAGIELSAYEDKTEIHILGYFLDDADPTFRKTLENLREVRKKRIYHIVEKLRELGVDITPEEVFKEAKDAAAGRPHVAQVLVKKKIVPNIKEAFRQYLADGKPACSPKEKLTTKEAIDLLKSVGGVPVLAHPAFLYNDDLIPKLIQEGLMGIEAYHSEQPAKVSKKYIELANQYNLLITGGSDCHGHGKDKILIGSVKMPYHYLEPLRQAHDRLVQTAL